MLEQLGRLYPYRLPTPACRRRQPAPIRISHTQRIQAPTHTRRGLRRDSPRRAEVSNHTYGSGGALAYLAAYDVHQVKIFGRTEPRTGIEPFMNLVAQVVSQEPYVSAKRVFWIVDNGASHRDKKVADRLTAAFPNAVMVQTPVHAPWLNQVEIYLSVVQRKVVSPNDFTDLSQVGDRPRAFEDRHNATAQPFRWKFTTSDLDDLLARVHRHTAGQPDESSFRLAA
ncbi:transposase [Streptomyces sp. NPDC004286]|uniref:transposase n=1 Tax=Streptomyces sp. NPDC004286 TaxID=3364696 RepID=UPI0036A55823